MDDNAVMSGILNGQNGTFFRDGYRITLMPSKLLVYDEETTVTPEKGYLYATTYRGKNVAFFVGEEPISIVADFGITTPIFVETDQPIQGVDLHHFSRVEFAGGSLDMLRRHRLSMPNFPKNDLMFPRILSNFVLTPSIASVTPESPRKSLIVSTIPNLTISSTPVIALNAFVKTSF